MVNNKTIDAKILSRMFLAGAKNLEAKKEWINDFMAWRLDELKIVIDGKEEIVPMRLDNVNVDIFKNQFLGRANRAFFMHFAKTEVASQLKSLANFIPNAFQKMRFKAC